jgi:outer membrane protein TolC
MPARGRTVVTEAWPYARLIATGVAQLAIVLALVSGAAAQWTLPRIEGPLTLEDAVERAIVGNLRVKAAAADARAMESMRRESQSAFWPQVSANGYFADQRMVPNVYTSAGDTMARNYQVFNANQTRDANITAMYSLFSGGRDYYSYRAASRRADAGREMQRGSELEAAMQARVDYINAVRESENARVTADLLREVEERLRLSLQLFEAGRAPRYYLLRDEAEHANTVQMDAMARSRADQALIALKTTIGVDVSSPVTLATRLDYAPASIDVTAAMRDAIERHPEVRAAAKQREAAESDVRAAYGTYWPQVSVSYMYDWAWMKDRGSQMPAETPEGYSVGVVVTLPVFDGFMRENRVKTARAKLERAVQDEQLTRQQIARDLNNAALMVQAAERAVEASRKGLEQAEEESRVIAERFGAGRGIQLEVLDAQVMRTRARFNAVNALADYQAAVAMWRRAVGER